MRISNYTNCVVYFKFEIVRVFGKILETLLYTPSRRRAAYAFKEVFVCEVQKWKGCTSP